MKNEIRLNLIGQAGSGKSTIAAQIKQKYGFEIIRPSAIISRIAHQRGIALNSREDYVYVNNIISRHEPDLIITEIEQASNYSELICIDGLRVLSRVKHLKKSIGLITIALSCPDNIRYERVAKDKSRTDSKSRGFNMSFDEFISHEAVDNQSIFPNKPSVPLVMEFADYEIDASRDAHLVENDIYKLIDSLF